MAAKPLSQPARVTGLCLVLAAMPLSLRLIWEMTLLTWQRGPQMIGFTVTHMMPWFRIGGWLCITGAAIWCVTVGGMAVVRLRTLTRLDWGLLVGGILTVGLPMIPYGVWEVATIRVLGAPRPESPAWMVMSDGLSSAAAANSTALLDRLVKRGADVNRRNTLGMTALDAASLTGSFDAALYLLRHGAQVNALMSGGMTALHSAAHGGHVDLVRLLLAAGADAGVKTAGAEGFTASDLAAMANHPAVSEFLDVRSSSPIRETKAVWKGDTVQVTIVASAPPLVSAIDRRYPRFSGFLTRRGEVINLKGLEDNGRYEAWGAEVVSKWYIPSLDLMGRSGRMEITVRFLLSQ